MIHGDDNIHDAMEKIALTKGLLGRAQAKAVAQAKLLTKAGKHGPAARRKYQATVFNQLSAKPAALPRKMRGGKVVRRGRGTKGEAHSLHQTRRYTPSGEVFLSAREVSAAERALQSKVKVASDDNVHGAMEKVALSSALKARAAEKAYRRARLLLRRGRGPEAARRIRQGWAASTGELGMVGVGASAKRTKAVESMLKSPLRRVRANIQGQPAVTLKKSPKSYSLAEALKHSSK